MKRIIKPYNEYIPSIIPEGKKAAMIDIPQSRNVSDYWIDDLNEQFIYSKIISNEYSDVRGKGRSFIQGNNLLIKDNYIRSCICKDGIVLIQKEWVTYYPSEFKRFKKMLKDNGFNTRGDKCFVFVNNLHNDITEAPLQPSLDDYSEEKQLEISTQFLEEERNKIRANKIVEEILELI